jgi:hypothetical protein
MINKSLLFPGYKAYIIGSSGFVIDDITGRAFCGRLPWRTKSEEDPINMEIDLS